MRGSVFFRECAIDSLSTGKVVRGSKGCHRRYSRQKSLDNAAAMETFDTQHHEFITDLVRVRVAALRP